MKKVVASILVVILMITSVPFIAAENLPVATVSKVVSEVTEFFDDGSKIVTTVCENIDSIGPVSTTYTKNGSKTQTGYNNSGDVMWTFTVNGTFRVVEGTSATCTAVSYSHTAPGSGWSLKTASTSKTANRAIGNATFVKKVLLITVDSIDTVCTLYCNVNGELS